MENENVNEIVEQLVKEEVKKAVAKAISEKLIPPIPVEITTTGVERYEKELEMLRSQENEIAELIQCYLDAIKEVRAKKFTPKEKLKKLLSPLISLHDIYFPNYLKHHEFIGDSHIDLNNEVNSKDLTYDSEKYSINCIKVDDSALLETRGRNIYISDEYWAYLIYCRDEKIISESEFKAVFEYDKKDPIRRVTFGKQDWEYDRTNKKWIDTKGVEADETTQRKIDCLMSTVVVDSRKSLADIYELWLPTLTEGKIRSKDLLDQILVCYAIKRALNWDQNAVDKLVELYKDAAIGTAIKMATKRALLKYDDIKQEAHIVLRVILSGFSPKSIIDSLQGDVNDFIPIPKSYINYYIWLYSEYVPAFIMPNLKKEIVKLILSGNYILSDIYTLLTPYAPIHDKTRWMKPKGTMVWRFNSYSFIPNKKAYLTVWLFGTENNYMQGRFCQLISDLLDKYSENKKEISDPLIDEKEDPKTLNIDDETLTKAQYQLVRDGFSKRDAEIFLKHRVQGFNKTKLAKEYSLSRRQIYRICKKFSLIPRLMSHF